MGRLLICWDFQSGTSFTHTHLAKYGGCIDQCQCRLFQHRFGPDISWYHWVWYFEIYVSILRKYLLMTAFTLTNVKPKTFSPCLALSIWDTFLLNVEDKFHILCYTTIIGTLALTNTCPIYLSWLGMDSLPIVAVLHNEAPMESLFRLVTLLGNHSNSPCWLWQDFSQTPLCITARHSETYSLQCPLSHFLLSKFMRHQRFRELSSPFCHSAGRPLRDHSESANYRWLMSSPPSRPVISPVLLFDWSGWAALTPMTSEAEV